MFKSSHWLAVAAFSLSAAGCVSEGKYDAALAEIDRARATQRAAQAASQKEVAELEAEVEQLKAYIQQAEARCMAISAELARQKQSVVGCVKALDETTAMNATLRAELVRLGKNAHDSCGEGQPGDSLEQAGSVWTTPARATTPSRAPRSSKSSAEAEAHDRRG